MIIYAPATVPGTGAISIIRLSGKGCLELVDKVVRFKRGTLSGSEGYTIKYGEVPSIDEVLVSCFRAPHSYTGEDSAEISCHASSYIIAEISRLLSEAGARLADPGEFSRRAFLNGKMDLSQTEAVADLIASSSAVAHKTALNQLKGGYSREIASLRDKLLELSSLLELELDFSEEDVEFADRKVLGHLLSQAISKVNSLTASFKDGNAIRSGVPIAIVGAPNSGKSSLLNALLGEERAIVSDIPGTTRDTVEETLTLGGIQFRFVDTAGIRESSDVIEMMGIERSRKKIDEADVVLVVVDVTGEFGADELLELVGGGKMVIVLYNKVDMVGASGENTLLQTENGTGIKKLWISAKNGYGLDELKSLLVESQQQRFNAREAEGAIVTNLRHYQALCEASSRLGEVQTSLSRDLPTELVAQSLRLALLSLGTITGEISNDEVLGNIFSKFCIGK